MKVIARVVVRVVMCDRTIGLAIGVRVAIRLGREWLCEWHKMYCFTYMKCIL